MLIDEVKEYEMCATDIQYFIENYVLVKTPKGKMKILLNDFQNKVLDHYVNGPHVVKLFGARQDGKSLIALCIALHETIFREYSTTVMIANKSANAELKFEEFLDIYEDLPTFLKPRSLKLNKTFAEFQNKSTFRIISSASYMKLRGTTIHSLFIDEFDFYPVTLADKIVEDTYPMICSGDQGRILMLSTKR